MKKYLCYVLAALSMMLCASSCNDNYEPQPDEDLTVYGSLAPSSFVVNMSDTTFRQMCQLWGYKTIVVNSADELPDDPIGFDDAYSSISYADRSLIIYYMVHQYNMVAYNYRYYKSGTDNSINWVIMPSVVEDKDSANNDFVFTRFAIMVPKPVDSSNLNIWMAVQRTTD